MAAGLRQSRFDVAAPGSARFRAGSGGLRLEHVGGEDAFQLGEPSVGVGEFERGAGGADARFGHGFGVREEGFERGDRVAGEERTPSFARAGERDERRRVAREGREPTAVEGGAFGLRIVGRRSFDRLLGPLGRGLLLFQTARQGDEASERGSGHAEEASTHQVKAPSRA